MVRLQIDAAINSGNSGGPAFNDKGTCVGIAFQSLKHDDAENIGYVIPTPVIRHFIRDYEKNGGYTGMFIEIWIVSRCFAIYCSYVGISANLNLKKIIKVLSYVGILFVTIFPFESPHTQNELMSQIIL